MTTNRPRSLIGRHAGVGLKAGSGGTLDVDLNELDTVVVDPSGDFVTLVTAAGLSKKVAIVDLIALVTGSGLVASAAGVQSIDLDGLSDAAAIAPATDTLIMIDESEAGDPTTLISILNLIAAVTGNGLQAAAGVQSVKPADTTINVAAGGIKAVADESTITTSGGTIAIKGGGVSIASLAAALLKGVTTVPMSFEAGEQAQVKVYFPYKVTINKIRGIATKAIADTTNGTITGANTDGTSANGVITAVALDALNTEYAVSPTTNNVVLADGFYKLTSAKVDAGGKVLVTLEWTRTA